MAPKLLPEGALRRVRGPPIYPPRVVPVRGEASRSPLWSRGPASRANRPLARQREFVAKGLDELVRPDALEHRPTTRIAGEGGVEALFPLGRQLLPRALDVDVDEEVGVARVAQAPRGVDGAGALTAAAG